jgi:hypothetical protein
MEYLHTIESAQISSGDALLLVLSLDAKPSYVFRTHHVSHGSRIQASPDLAVITRGLLRVNVACAKIM